MSVGDLLKKAGVALLRGLLKKGEKKLGQKVKGITKG